MTKPSLDLNIQMMLNYHLGLIEKHTDSDVLTIKSGILPNLHRQIKEALESKASRRDKLTVILDTLGGSAEVVERMVNTIRHHYLHVDFVVPDKAMSAGTIFVMSGDNIFMNYHSVLGPIDPQVLKGDKWVPALSYLRQYEIFKSRGKSLTTAEVILMQKLDSGELHQYEKARDLSIELLKKWLSAYKFKDWYVTEEKQQSVTNEMKTERAKEIADALSDIDRWHSHSRGIDMKTLCGLKLKIEDYTQEYDKAKEIDQYFKLFDDYLTQKGWISWIHTAEYF
jgi:membrane-bound ClpP family serine protease